VAKSYLELGHEVARRSLKRGTRYLVAFLTLPAVLFADAISTFVGLNLPFGLVEVNQTIVSLYEVGVWVVAIFHSLSIAAALGYALLMYYLTFRSKLPLWSRKLCAASYFTSASFLSTVPIHNVSMIAGHILVGGADIFGKYELLLSTGIPVGLALVLTLYLDYLAVRLG